MKRFFTVRFSFALLVIEVLFYLYIRRQTDWIETVFVPHVYTPLSVLLRWLTQPFPFSVGLVLIYILAVLLVYGLLLSIKRRTFRTYLRRLISIAPVVFLVYLLTWGLLYYRQPISSLLSYDTSPVRTEELHTLCSRLVANTNRLRRSIDERALYSSSPEVIFSRATNAYETSSIPFLSYRTPSIKLATGSTLLAYMGTSGIYTFWSGEANVNRINVPVDMPSVALHEMAHQVGFASEDEANYVAWLVGSNSPDTTFQYAAHYGVVWRALRQLYAVDTVAANTLFHSLDPAVHADLERDRERWEPYRNFAQRYVISPLYSTFLKINGRTDGIRSYDRVIDLLVYEQRKALPHLPENP